MKCVALKNFLPPCWSRPILFSFYREKSLIGWGWWWKEGSWKACPDKMLKHFMYFSFNSNKALFCIHSSDHLPIFSPAVTACMFSMSQVIPVCFPRYSNVLHLADILSAYFIWTWASCALIPQPHDCEFVYFSSEFCWHLLALCTLKLWYQVDANLKVTFSHRLIILLSKYWIFLSVVIFLL